MCFDDDFDLTFHDPPSSPFVSYVEVEDQENVAPGTSQLSVKNASVFEDSAPPTAQKASPEKKAGLREHASPAKESPVKNLMEDFQKATRESSTEANERSRKSLSPTKLFRATSPEACQSAPPHENDLLDLDATPMKRATSPQRPTQLHQKEGLTAALELMEQAHTTPASVPQVNSPEEIDFELMPEGESHYNNPDGPDFTSGDMDDTSFSMFSEMPGLDLTKFALLTKKTTRDDEVNVSSSYQNLESVRH